jgi:hypothetical protein
VTVPGSVSGGTFTPSSALAANTTYTVTVSGASDAAGNTMAVTSWSFTTAAAGSGSGCPCSIWSSTVTPGTPADSDNSAVEVGTRFRASTSGQVTGVRFYKGSGNSGAHVGHLWTASGTLLGTVTFSGESATGWQTATLATPIPITAGTTYVVSYYAPVGRYATDADYFTTSVLNGPLEALGGVYHYATGGGFPTDTWQASTYWVDVVFNG